MQIQQENPEAERTAPAWLLSISDSCLGPGITLLSRSLLQHLLSSLLSRSQEPHSQDSLQKLLTVTLFTCLHLQLKKGC